MAVLISKDNKELIINCNCGCNDSVHIKIDDQDKNLDYYAFLTYLSSNFYSEQYTGFRLFAAKAKKIWAIVRGKDYCYSDIVMNKEEFETFVNYMTQFLVDGGKGGRNGRSYKTCC